jgi:hypothetical protein
MRHGFAKLRAENGDSAMGAFEHIIALLSFVYALAIAHLLLTLAGLIRASERVRFSWLHGFWMANALIVLIVDWISFWDLRSLPRYGIGTIFLFVGIALIDYLQAALVCPEIPAEGPIDLVQFHAAQSRRYIGAFAAAATMALVTNTVLGGAFNIAEWERQNLAAAPLLAVALVAAIFRARWVQIGAPFALAAIWTFYFADLQGALGS